MSDVQLVAITRPDGGLSVMSFVTRGRSPILPPGASWELRPGGAEVWTAMSAELPTLEPEVARALVAEFVSQYVTGFWVRPPTFDVVDAEVKRAKPGALAWRFIAEADLPARRYRNAYRDTGQAIALDMPHARELRLAALRAERAARFAELDADYVKAMQRGQGAQAVADEAERLREMPVTLAPLLDAAADADALDAITLASLERKNK